MEIINQQLLITNVTKNQTDKADVDTAQIKTICPPLILKCSLLEEPSISVAYGFRSIKSNPSKTRLKTSIKRRPFGNKTLGVKRGRLKQFQFIFDSVAYEF